MAKPDLYICHTAYHVLIALVRALRAGGGQAAVLSAQVPGAEVTLVYGGQPVYYYMISAE